MNYIIFEEIKFVKGNLDTAKEFLNDFEKSKSKKDLYALERVAEQIVETSIKINKRLLKEKKLFPANYKESFELLKKLDFLDKILIEKLSQTASFRNKLAHDYKDMNNFYSVKNIKNIINIYPAYLNKLIQFLENN